MLTVMAQVWRSLAGSAAREECSSLPRRCGRGGRTAGKRAGVWMEGEAAAWSGSSALSLLLAASSCCSVLLCSCRAADCAGNALRGSQVWGAAAWDAGGNAALVLAMPQRAALAGSAVANCTEDTALLAASRTPPSPSTVLHNWRRAPANIPRAIDQNCLPCSKSKSRSTSWRAGSIQGKKCRCDSLTLIDWERQLRRTLKDWRKLLRASGSVPHCGLSGYARRHSDSCLDKYHARFTLFTISSRIGCYTA